MNVEKTVFHHNADERVCKALCHAPTEKLRVGTNALVIAFRHYSALMENHESKGMAVIGTLLYEGLRYGGKAFSDGGVA